LSLNHKVYEEHKDLIGFFNISFVIFVTLVVQIINPVFQGDEWPGLNLTQTRLAKLVQAVNVGRVKRVAELGLGQQGFFSH
jgi:hypothetical protein